MTTSVRVGGAAGGLVLAGGAPLIAGLDVLTLSLMGLGLLATVFAGLEARAAVGRKSHEPPDG